MAEAPARSPGRLRAALRAAVDRGVPQANPQPGRFNAAAMRRDAGVPSGAFYALATDEPQVSTARGQSSRRSCTGDKAAATRWLLYPCRERKRAVSDLVCLRYGR
jgi:hypothetical protein